MVDRCGDDVALRYARAVRLFEMARIANGTAAPALVMCTLAGAARALAEAARAAQEVNGNEPPDTTATWGELCRARQRFGVLRELCPQATDGPGKPAATTDDAGVLVTRFQELLVLSRARLNAGLRPAADRTGRRRPGAKTVALTATVVVVATLLWAGIVTLYRLADPMSPATTGGQVFWAVNTGGGFTQDRSVRFDVRVDGRSYLYRLELPQAPEVELFRIDPANDTRVTQVTLQRVSLLGADGTARWTWTPGSDGEWHCQNCVIVKRTPVAMVIRTGHRDPHLVTGTVGAGPGPVNTVEITMSARSQGVSFWRWLLRIER